MDNIKRSRSQGSSIHSQSGNFITEDESEVSSRSSSYRGQYPRLQGTLSAKRSNQIIRNASVKQFIVPKGNCNKNTGFRVQRNNIYDISSSETNERDYKNDYRKKTSSVTLRPARSEKTPDRYYSHSGNYEYYVLEPTEDKIQNKNRENTKTNDYKRNKNEQQPHTTRQNRVQVVNGTFGSCYSTSITGSSKFSDDSNEDDSESDESESEEVEEHDYEENENILSKSSKDQTGSRKKSERLSVSFSEDTGVTSSKYYPKKSSQQQLSSSAFERKYGNKTRIMTTDISRDIKSRKKKTGLVLPDDPYANILDVEPFQMSIPKTPSPPPAIVAPKLKTKTVSCLYEEPPIEKYKTAILDIGEKVKEEPREEIVVIPNEPPEWEDIPPSPLGETVLTYHIPPSPEPEPVIEPLPTPPPPPYKPPKIKNNPIVTRVGGGWMQIDHHRRNHIPLMVYNKQRYDGRDSFLYIKSKYTKNRQAEPISYRNKSHLLQKLQRESAVVILN